MHVEHYTKFRHEVIDLSSRLDFTWGNFFKYVCRAPFKGDFTGDVKKAIDYAIYALKSEHVTSSPTLDEVASKIADDFVDDLNACGERELALALSNVARNRTEAAVIVLEDLLEARRNAKKVDAA